MILSLVSVVDGEETTLVKKTSSIRVIERAARNEFIGPTYHVQPNFTGDGTQIEGGKHGKYSVFFNLAENGDGVGGIVIATGNKTELRAVCKELGLPLKQLNPVLQYIDETI